MSRTDASTEVFKVDRYDNESLVECASALPVPEVNMKSTGGFLKGYQGGYTSVVCGGVGAFGGIRDLCHSLSVVNGSYFEVSMLSSRSGAASVVLNNSRSLWMTGGYNLEVKSWTTEIIHLNQEGNLTACPGPHMPVSGLKYHCIEQIGPGMAALLVGGQVYNLKGRSKRAWSINPEVEDTWTEQAPMDIGRSNHACAILDELTGPGVTRIAIAAGGFTFDGVITDAVELLRIEIREGIKGGSVSLSIDSSWQPGPIMPSTISDAATATTPDKRAAFVAGGISNDNEIMASVLEIQCSNLECLWKKCSQELRTPSDKGLAMIMTIGSLAFVGEEEDVLSCKYSPQDSKMS